MAFYKFFLAQMEGRALTIFEDGNQTRDFTFVKDIVAGTIGAASNGKDGKTYNLGGGSRITVNDVLRMIREITGKELDIRYVDKQKGDMRDTFASTENARNDFGYSPSVSLREGLTREYEWLKDLYKEGQTHRVE